jgi:3-oxoacyl-[acyl-carrier protein] reductase
LTLTDSARPPALASAGKDGNRPSALITGASRGIGLGIARLMSSAGWALTITARNQERLNKVESELHQAGVPVMTLPADMADEESVASVVDRHQQAYGTMNCLVLSAGVGMGGPVEQYPLRQLDRQLAVNFRAPFQLISRSLPLLRAGARERPAVGGRIIALTSIEGVYPEADLSAYAASKAALISLIRSVNRAEAPHGVTASAISPAFVDTDMSSWVADRIPPESMITVNDVVHVVSLMLNLSPRAVIAHVVMNRVGTDPYKA